MAEQKMRTRDSAEGSDVDCVEKASTRRDVAVRKDGLEQPDLKICMLHKVKAWTFPIGRMETPGASSTKRPILKKGIIVVAVLAAAAQARADGLDGVSYLSRIPGWRHTPGTAVLLL